VDLIQGTPEEGVNKYRKRMVSMREKIRGPAGDWKDKRQIEERKVKGVKVDREVYRLEDELREAWTVDGEGWTEAMVGGCWGTVGGDWGGVGGSEDGMREAEDGGKGLEIMEEGLNIVGNGLWMVEEVLEIVERG
jgi:hypothetical protein